MQRDITSRWKWKNCKEFPVDYSYFNITSLAGGGLPGRCRYSSVKPEPSRDSRSRYISSTVCLSNNSLAGLEGLLHFLEKRIQRPELVKWLDLSCNKISQLDNDLLKLSGLKILYLHSNCLDFDEVGKLSGLKSLKILTLYGNPIEIQTDYRLRVIAYLPGLRRLDFSPITERETFLARPYCTKRKRDEPSAEQGKPPGVEAEVEGEVTVAAESLGDENAGEGSGEEGGVETEVGEEAWTSEGSSDIPGSLKRGHSERREIPLEMTKATENERKHVEKLYQQLRKTEKRYQFNYFDGLD